MRFEKLEIKNWRQFSEIDLDLHPRVTIITGANGAGKTTLLRLLSQHFGWSPGFLATPRRLSDSGRVSYFTGLFRRFRLSKEGERASNNEIGRISYSNGSIASIVVPETGTIAFNVSIQNQQVVEGLHINSHRPLQNYKQVESIPTNAIGAQQAFQTYQQEMLAKFQGGYTNYSPIYRMKESIISMATFGPGNDNVQKNVEIEKTFLDFKEILGKVLPPTIGFKDISIRIPDVVFVTQSGEFVLDAASGGLMSIIDLAWQIFLFSRDRDEFTVTIDEAENHLHPSMQRSLLRRLVDAFPKAQFIVVTHSPFIVSSIKDSFVHVLKYQDNSISETDDFTDRKIISIKLDLDTKAATATEVLRDVLGVTVTLPEWAEEDLQGIVDEFRGSEINQSTLDGLRFRLGQAGLSEYFPDALRIIAR